MKFLVTGAGQIGSQLVSDLVAGGHDVVVLRRRDSPVEGADVLSGDVLDGRLLRKAMAGVAAVFHCVHTAYDAKKWKEFLPSRERAVMDAAADAGIPVVFPESVYGFGDQSVDLPEGAKLSPRSPLGEVRALLLTAREQHRARTVSVVASDLWGPTALPATSVAHLAVLVPRPQGKRGYALGNPSLPHTLTYIPDLTSAMIYSAMHAGALAPAGDRILHTPSPETGSLEDLNELVSLRSGVRYKRLLPVPNVLLRTAGLVSPMMAELKNQAYLWNRPAILRSGVLAEEHGLKATTFEAGLEATRTR
ncbi:NAD-dependent epimerase/dehydratase family protein [Kocuria sp. TGY1127_2]|uniref:NAD-dependent epimerase/dehydratase family protein n=1 Tax=Kocuria sp. TGY1127_2 TaxID=2711328 RepID=UPI0015B94448|nr:NAD-dependent epimerase/dehydratase family protein [Kocuria sp. TGY1127_2]